LANLCRKYGGQQLDHTLVLWRNRSRGAAGEHMGGATARVRIRRCLRCRRPLHCPRPDERRSNLSYAGSVNTFDGAGLLPTRISRERAAAADPPRRPCRETHHRHFHGRSRGTDHARLAQPCGNVVRPEVFSPGGPHGNLVLNFRRRRITELTKRKLPVDHQTQAQRESQTHQLPSPGVRR
jgi:hypothetical protein